MAVWALRNGLDCRTCTAYYQQHRGCREDLERPWDINGYEARRCPVLAIGDSERAMLEAYWHYRNGYLPNDGGWLDQPTLFAQAMVVIDRLMNEKQEETPHGK